MADENKIVRHLTYVEQGHNGQPNTTITYDIGTDAAKVKYHDTTVEAYLDDPSHSGGSESGSSNNFNNNGSILISQVSQSDPNDPSTKTSSIQQSSFKIGDTVVNDTNPYKKDFAKLLKDFNELKTNFDKFTNNDTAIGKFIGSDTHDNFIVTSDWYISPVSATQIKIICRYGNGRKVNMKLINVNKNEKVILNKTNIDLGTGTHTETITVNSSTFSNNDRVRLTITSAESSYTISEGGTKSVQLTVGKNTDRFYVKWSRKGGAARNKNIINTSLLDLFYPKGSIYMSVEDTHPTALFGGTWERIKGRFIFGSYPDEYYISGNHSATEYNTCYRIGNIGGSVYLGKHHHSTPKVVTDVKPTTKKIVDSGNKTAFVKSVGETKAAGTTGDTGYGNDGLSMPPYYVANIWRRTG